MNWILSCILFHNIQFKIHLYIILYVYINLIPSIYVCINKEIYEMNFKSSIIPYVYINLITSMHVSVNKEIYTMYYMLCSCILCSVM